MEWTVKIANHVFFYSTCKIQLDQPEKYNICECDLYGAPKGT